MFQLKKERSNLFFCKLRFSQMAQIVTYKYATKHIGYLHFLGLKHNLVVNAPLSPN